MQSTDTNTKYIVFFSVDNKGKNTLLLEGKLYWTEALQLILYLWHIYSIVIHYYELNFLSILVERTNLFQASFQWLFLLL